MHFEVEAVFVCEVVEVLVKAVPVLGVSGLPVINHPELNLLIVSQVLEVWELKELEVDFFVSEMEGQELADLQFEFETSQVLLFGIEREVVELGSLRELEKRDGDSAQNFFLLAHQVHVEGPIAVLRGIEHHLEVSVHHPERV